MIKSFVLFMLGVCLVSLALAQTPSTDATATGDAFLKQAKYQEALDAYLEVVRTDSRNAAAHHGAGLAYNALGQSALAAKSLERAYSLSPKDRAIVHNTALVLFKNETQPRALKLIKDYLTAVPKPADEPMLESLRYMLQNATDDVRSTRLYTEVETFAQQYTKAIERERPGFAKWGHGWITAKDAAAKAAANKKVQAEADTFNTRLKGLERDISMLERRTPEVEARVRKGWDFEYVLTTHLNQIRMLNDQRAEVLRERQLVLDKLDQPAAAVEPGWIALGTPAPALPAADSLIARTSPPAVDEPAAPATPRRPERPKRAPVGADEEAAAVDPPEEPNTAPPAPPEKVAKRVTRYGVAFAISQDTLVTSNDLVSGAFDITVQSPQGTTDEAKIVKSDPKSGLSLIRISKLKAAALHLAPGFDGGAIECIGMPNVDLFKPDASVISGKCDKPAEPWTVALDKNPRLPGAPLLAGGKVVGVTLATRDTEAGSVPAVTLQRLSDLVATDTGTRGAFTTDPKAAVFQIVATHESK
jgi:Flp pilus assembly protein TadD